MMKRFIFISFLIPLALYGQIVEGKKLFSIKVAIGESQSSVGEYLNLKTVYAPYTKGVFDDIANVKVLPVGGDYPLYYNEDGKTYADLDIDMVLLTRDNEKIYCKVTGVLTM